MRNRSNKTKQPIVVTVVFSQAMALTARRRNSKQWFMSYGWQREETQGASEPAFMVPSATRGICQPAMRGDAPVRLRY
jgi:hypothetical protein